MKKIVILMLGVLAFSWISGVSAGNWQGEKRKWGGTQSPESLVTCSSFYIDGIYTYVVIFSAISKEINAEMCAYTSLCNPCIESLEKQRCKVVDLEIDHKVTNSDPVAWATYGLSCKAP